MRISKGELIHNDAMTVMSWLPSESIDLVVTDPPYRTISGGNTTASGRCSGILAKNDGKIFEHNDIKVGEYLPEIYRILKPGSDCYIMTNNLNLRQLLNVADELGFKFSNLLVWKKNTLTPNRRYMKNIELTCFFYKPPSKTINNPSSNQYFEWNNPRDKLHPTEKPVALMEHYIANSSKEGDLVLDPFAGSASTAVACERLNRRWICVEKDIKYYIISLDRLLNDRKS